MTASYTSLRSVRYPVRFAPEAQGSFVETPMDLTKYRAEFPAADRRIHLTHAGSSPLSLRARSALEAWAAGAAGLADAGYEYDAPTTDPSDSSAPPYARSKENASHVARRNAATLIGCRPSEVAFTSTTSEGVSFFAASLDWRVADNVVTASNEFPANTYPWMNLQRRGVHVRMVNPTPEGRIAIDDLLAACDSRTRVIAISWVGYNTGFRIGLARLADECRKRQILLFVDAIQGLGAFEMKAAEWGVAAASAETHKWLLGTEGVAFLYVSKDLIGSLHPPVVGWRSVKNADDFMTYDFTLADSARRFEPGCLNMAGIVVANAGMELLLEAGIPNITARIKELTDYLCRRLEEKKIQILSPRGESEWSGIVSFRAPGGDGPALAARLKEQDIILTGRADFLRASPHFYNTESDLDRVLSQL